MRKLWRRFLLSVWQTQAVLVYREIPRHGLAPPAPRRRGTKEPTLPSGWTRTPTVRTDDGEYEIWSSVQVGRRVLGFTRWGQFSTPCHLTTIVRG